MRDDFPFMMHKRTFAFCPATKEALAECGTDFVLITRAQAEELSRDRAGAGVRILREVVARDNEAALAEAEATAAAARAAGEAANGESPSPTVEAQTPWYIRQGGQGAQTPPPPPPPPPPPVVSQTVGTAASYEGMTLEQLRNLAADREIAGAERMSRKQIAEKLAESDHMAK